MSSTSTLSAEVVREEMEGLKGLVDSYAGRASLVAALRDDTRTPAESAVLRRHLDELRLAHEGIYTASVLEPDGTLIDVARRPRRSSARISAPRLVPGPVENRVRLRLGGLPRACDRRQARRRRRHLRSRRPWETGRDPRCRLPPRVPAEVCGRGRGSPGCAVAGHRPARDARRTTGERADHADLSPFGPRCRRCARRRNGNRRARRARRTPSLRLRPGRSRHRLDRDRLSAGELGVRCSREAALDRPHHRERARLHPPLRALLARPCPARAAAGSG